MRRIYLDYNATTPVAPSVYEAMLPFLHSDYGNPSSAHWMGRAALEGMADARGHVANVLGCAAEEVIFTGCGTEANNLALKGVMMREKPSTGAHLVISGLEHPAVSQPARFLQRLGYAVTIVPPDAHGVVSPLAIERALQKKTRLVSVMHANNEIGTIQPIREIAEICHSRSILLHTDAAQTVGKISTQVEQLDVDLLSTAAHKFYGPKGIGALYIREGLDLEPLLHGGDQEQGLRAGTENTSNIAGMGQAAMLVHRALDESAERMSFLRDDLQRRLETAIGPELIVHGRMAPRLPNTLSVNFPRVSARQMLERLPQLCASTGSACHSSSSGSSTLAAMGLSSEQTQGTIRLSLGWYTSQEDVEIVAEWLIDAWEVLR